MKFLAFSQTKLGSSLALPANGLGGSRATSLLVAHFALQNTKFGSEKEKVQKPARIHSPDPFLRAGKFSRGFAKSFSPENSFGKTESALKPHALPRNFLGRTPKEKHPFLFQKKFTPHQIRNARSVFSFGVAGVLASAWGLLRVICFENRFELGTINTPNETCSELRKQSDFAEAKIALSIFSKLFPPTAEAVNSQSSPQ